MSNTIRLTPDLKQVILNVKNNIGGVFPAETIKNVARAHKRVINEFKSKIRNQYAFFNRYAVYNESMIQYIAKGDELYELRLKCNNRTKDGPVSVDELEFRHSKFRYIFGLTAAFGVWIPALYGLIAPIAPQLAQKKKRNNHAMDDLNRIIRIEEIKAKALKEIRQGTYVYPLIDDGL